MNWLWMGGHAPRSKNCVVCFCLFSKRIVVEMDKKLYLQQKFKTNPKKCFDHIWGFIYAKRQTNYCSKSYKNRLKTSVLRRFLVRVGRLELPASCSQSKRATNCATPGYSVFLHDTMRRGKKQVFRVCGRRCGQARFCGNFSTGEFSPQATVPRTSGISLSGEWIGRLSSQIKRNTTFTISRYSMFHFTFDTYQQTGILFAHRLTIS